MTTLWIIPPLHLSNSKVFIRRCLLTIATPSLWLILQASLRFRLACRNFFEFWEVRQGRVRQYYWGAWVLNPYFYKPIRFTTRQSSLRALYDPWAGLLVCPRIFFEETACTAHKHGGNRKVLKVPKITLCLIITIWSIAQVDFRMGLAVGIVHRKASATDHLEAIPRREQGLATRPAGLLSRPFSNHFSKRVSRRESISKN